MKEPHFCMLIHGKLKLSKKYWVGVVENRHGHFGLRTLKLALSPEGVNGVS